jgi:hypothetical protein
MLQSLYLSLPSADARKFVVAVRDARKARDERIEAAIARTEAQAKRAAAAGAAEDEAARATLRRRHDEACADLRRVRERRVEGWRAAAAECARLERAGRFAATKLAALREEEAAAAAAAEAEEARLGAVPPLKGKGKGKEGAAAAVVVDEEDVLEREEAAAARAEEALAELRRDADQEATLIAGEVRKVASQ